MITQQICLLGASKSLARPDFLNGFKEELKNAEVESVPPGFSAKFDEKFGFMNGTFWSAATYNQTKVLCFRYCPERIL